MRSATPTLLIVTAIAYSANYPLGSLALQSMSAFLLIALRFAVTAVIAWAAVLTLRVGLPTGRTWWHAIGAGFLVQGVQFLGLYWAMSHGVSAGISALIVAMNPVVATIISAFLDRKREPWLRYVAVLIGALAVILACIPRIARDSSVGPGIVAVLIALAGLALGSAWQGRKLQGVSPVSFTAIGVTVSLPPAAALALLTPWHVTEKTSTWVMFAVVTVVGLAATTLYATTVGRVGARSASILFAVIPALAAMGAWLILGEPLDIIIVIALVLGGAACLLDVVGVRLHARRPVGGTLRDST